ncbi:MAG: prepilin-type N-terminal cleavage/methylation domain-containing protein [Planctomycetota bacterium]
MIINLKEKNSNSDRSGFTLIELLITIFIILIIAGIVGIRLDLKTEMSKKEITKREMQLIFKAIMGDERSETGFFHETKTSFKSPMRVSFLISKDALADYLEKNIDDPIFTWDPNHRRGYRPGAYLKGENIDSTVGSYPTLLDPWNNAYIIHRPNDDDDEARIVSFGPDGKIGDNGNTDYAEKTKDEIIESEYGDDLVLYLKN